MSDNELTASYKQWEDQWNIFLQWIIETYRDVEKLPTEESPL